MVKCGGFGVSLGRKVRRGIGQLELPGAVACRHTTLDYDLWLSILSSAEGSNVAVPARLCGSAVEGVRLTG